MGGRGRQGGAHLYVHQDNAPARAFYRRLGFVATGATMPYDPDPSQVEIEMAQPLGRAG